MNPAIKLILLLSFSSLVIFTPSLVLHLLLFILLLILALFNSHSRQLFNRLKPLFFITFFIIIFQLIFNHPETLITRVSLGFKAGLKITLLSLLVFFFTLTTDFQQLVSSLKFLPSSAVVAITATFSLIPAILAQAKLIKLAQTTRGYHSKFNPLPLIIPLLHKTIQRSEHLSLTLYLRGFH